MEKAKLNPQGKRARYQAWLEANCPSPEQLFEQFVILGSKMSEEDLSKAAMHAFCNEENVNRIAKWLSDNHEPDACKRVRFLQLKGEELIK